jgi:GT2 family glycosyltransferase
MHTIGTASAPLVTVVIATRNRGESVTRPIRSILSNEYPNFNIVVVDQSADDLTGAALRPFLEDPHVRYIRSSTEGVATGRNIGIGTARGELITITDDDCEVPASWLRRFTAAFAFDRNVGVVFGNVLAAPHDPGAGFAVAYERREPFLARSIREKCRVEGTGACMGVRRSVWQALGGFDELLGIGAPFKAAEETDFAIRALLAGYFVYETPDISVVHWGVRAPEHIQSVIHGYWYGTGAAFAKHLRCGRWSVAHLLLKLAWRWAFGRSPVAASLGRRAGKLPRLAAFVRGLAAGVATPVDKPTGHYIRRVRTSAAG